MLLIDIVAFPTDFAIVVSSSTKKNDGAKCKIVQRLDLDG